MVVRRFASTAEADRQELEYWLSGPRATVCCRSGG
jgi:hypothetical protein